MILLSDIDLDSSGQCKAKFEALHKDGQVLLFEELISLPRGLREQLANHLERIKKEVGSDKVRFVGLS